MTVMACFGLILDRGGINRDTASFLLRVLVDVGVVLKGGRAILLGKVLGDGGGKSGFAVIDMT